MKTSEGFVVGKHGIGYVSSSFISRIGDTEFEPVSAPPRAITLPRDMNDAVIESELKPGICTLGDVLAVMDSSDKAFKDGYANIFYLPSCVVLVYWYGGEWSVDDWGRDDSAWSAGGRVFSPASGRSSTVSSGPTDLSLESLDARLKKIEGLINPKLLK